MGNLALTGIDTSDKPYLLFYDIKDIKQSLKICVKECPTKTLNTIEDIYNYHTKGVDLCRYDFTYNELQKSDAVSARSFGPCPVLPVYERYIRMKLFDANFFLFSIYVHYKNKFILFFLVNLILRFIRLFIVYLLRLMFSVYQY